MDEREQAWARINARWSRLLFWSASIAAVLSAVLVAWVRSGITDDEFYLGVAPWVCALLAAVVWGWSVSFALSSRAILLPDSRFECRRWGQRVRATTLVGFPRLTCWGFGVWLARARDVRGKKCRVFLCNEDVNELLRRTPQVQPGGYSEAPDESVPTGNPIAEIDWARTLNPRLRSGVMGFPLRGKRFHAWGEQLATTAQALAVLLSHPLPIGDAESMGRLWSRRAGLSLFLAGVCGFFGLQFLGGAVFIWAEMQAKRRGMGGALGQGPDGDVLMFGALGLVLTSIGLFLLFAAFRSSRSVITSPEGIAIRRVHGRSTRLVPWSAVRIEFDRMLYCFAEGHSSRGALRLRTLVLPRALRALATFVQHAQLGGAEIIVARAKSSTQELLRIVAHPERHASASEWSKPASLRPSADAAPTPPPPTLD